MLSKHLQAWRSQRRFHRRWIIGYLVFFLLWGPFSLGVKAQYKSPLDDLRLPHHKVTRIPHKNRSTWVMLSPQTLEHNLKYYLQRCQPGPDSAWILESPDLSSAQAWIAALYQTSPKENANFMLNLHHKQTGVNVILTIGALNTTSAPPFRSIITLYTAPKRKGGK